jgi:ABC-type glycerol-3-phosphate transport system substrate-binding protein
MFPCPDGGQLASYTNDYVMVIPSSYDVTEANEIAYAFNLFTDPVPGYTYNDALVDKYASQYPDSKAVSETLIRMRNGVNFNYFNPYVIGLEDVLNPIYDAMYVGAKTPAAAVKSIQSSAKTRIKEQNATLDAAEAAKQFTWNQYK